MELLLWIVAVLVAWRLLSGLSTRQAIPGNQPVAAVPDYAAPLDGTEDAGMNSDYSLSDIVQGVIQAESGGRQTDANGNTLRSSAGALGIMQLEPSTAAAIGVDPNDREQNIQGGTIYLSQLYAEFGNWFDALAAYNWGPGNVRKAQAAGTPYPASVRAYANGILAG